MKEGIIMKTKIKRFLSAFLVAVMLFGIAPLNGFAGLNFDWLDFSTKSSAVADSDGGEIIETQSITEPAFTVNIVSETSDEVKLSFNLVRGSFAAMDLQINASDWNNSNKTTGLTLKSTELGSSYKKYMEGLSQSETPLLSFAPKNGNGKVAIVVMKVYDVEGEMFVFTFSKSSSRNVKPSDFIAESSCFDEEGKRVIPSLTCDWEYVCLHYSLKHCVEDSTCYTNGKEYDVCTDCGKIFNETVIPMGHKLKHEVVPSTCTKHGTEYDLCTGCGEKFNEKSLPLEEHSWGEWTLAQKPTATAEGLECRICANCMKMEFRDIAKLQADVKSVSIDDVTLNYKKSTILNPTITADDGAEYTVKYTSSNTSVATVDKNGKVTATKRGSGSATITCTVTDSNGNTVTDTCKVNVKLSFGQILITYILFGWIWY